jgi:uncharacterized protein YycO
MKIIKTVTAVVCAVALLAGPALAADKAVEKKTCCQTAKANSKECTHKCCVAAHKEAKSCLKCNPNKEDLQKDKKEANRAEKAAK